MTDNFWSETKRFRIRVILLFVAWIPFGLITTLIWVKVLGLEMSIIVGFGMILFWQFLYLRMRHKFKQLELKCPRCDKLAFDDVPSLFAELRCANCGFQKENSLNK